MTTVIRTERKQVVAPSSPVGSPGAKGDPGGNVMAIGLFTAFAALSIPSGTDIVRTAGYSSTGVGVAEYMYDAAVDSAYVTAHPRTSAISSNGRGFRLRLEQDLTPQMAGGKGDLTAIGAGTDNSAAINALIAAHATQAKCATIIIPKTSALYRCGSTITALFGVRFIGHGFHENPGVVAGTTYAYPQNYRGSVLVFDQNVKGFELFDFTDNLANATTTEFEGSRFSIFQDLMVLGGGGTTVTAHGFDIHTIVDFRNVRGHGFAGNGANINCNVTGANTYGNADGSSFGRVQFDGNGCHGVYVSGDNANTMSFVKCRFANNGGAGYIDFSTVGGNKLDTCDFATNNQSWGAGTAQTTKVQADSSLLATQANGSIIIVNASNTPHVLDTIYVESGVGRLAHVPSGTLIVGGPLGQLGSALLTATSAPTVVDGSGFFQGVGVKSLGDLTLHHGAGAHLYVVNDAGGTAIIETRPGGGTFSELRLTGNSNSIAAGLDILAGGGNGYFSADGFTLRNAGQTTTFLTADAVAVKPGVDNVANLGSGALRWGTVYAGTGTINTSDARHKTAVEAPSDALLDAWSEVEWQAFKFSDAVKKKGKNGARLHVGLIAQHVRDVLEKHGLNGFDLGLLCYDEWDDIREPISRLQTVIVTDEVPNPKFKDRRSTPKEPPVLRVKRKTKELLPVIDKKTGLMETRVTVKAGNRFGVRYEEALALEAALLRRTTDRLEKRLQALESAAG